MDEEQFKERTIGLALGVIALARQMQREMVNDVLVRQLLRSATSVASNYSAACRARSDVEMLAKLAIVEEEADETLFWLRLLQRASAVPATATQPLEREADEILRMTVASIRTLRARVNSGGGRTQVPARRQAARANPKSEIRNPK